MWLSVSKFQHYSACSTCSATPQQTPSLAVKGETLVSEYPPEVALLTAAPRITCTLSFLFFFFCNHLPTMHTPSTVWKNDYPNFNVSSAEMESEAEEGT